MGKNGNQRELPQILWQLFPQLSSSFSYGRPESWSERRFLSLSAFAFTSGKGFVPALHPAFPEARFAEVEERVSEPLDPDLQRILDDYFESTLASGQYAVVNRPGWPLLEKFRALALAYPVALWMLRYFANNGTPKRDAAISVITTIERGQGYAPLVGLQHRQRLSRLKSQQELERLIAWYGRADRISG